MSSPLSSPPLPILLIHGAWSCGALWDPVVARLRARGLSVRAPDLPGHGQAGIAAPETLTPQTLTPQTPNPETITLADYAQAIAAWLAEGPPALLVGHSMGGMAITAAAALAPQQVARLAYVCAFLPGADDSLTGLMAGQPPTIAPAVQRGARRGTTELNTALALPLLAQDAPPAAQARLAALACAQPNRPQTDRLSPAQAQASAALPRAYLLCEADRTITPDLQRAMIANRPCDPVITLPAGHFPQLSHPDLLADHLAALAMG